MRLQFKYQQFQTDAAKAVVDVFAGQPYNAPQIVPELSDQVILEHIQDIQRSQGIEVSQTLEGRYNLTIEMETGVGKTYTYIKTMYELNKHYGWNKFIIVVPSIAVREGVYKSFQITQEHFAGEYGKKIQAFVYNSSKLEEIDHFASDNSMNAMIINAQAFNARGKDARRIYMELDEFGSRRPIDIIASAHPIVIIDEPQSVEGKQTRKSLIEFNPLLTLRYSATHRSDSLYNMVYRLNAVEAYNRKLVKQITVKGIAETECLSDSFVYLEKINLSKASPTATLQFHKKTDSGVKMISRTTHEGYDLYEVSGKLEEYREGFTVKTIDGRDDSVEFVNGIKLISGEMIGKANENQLRRIQIRETILSHIEKERQLFSKGIKVLSLFFIDEVAHYRKYDSLQKPSKGVFAEMFEQEYQSIVDNLELNPEEGAYRQYLEEIPIHKTHEGYFSVDKKGNMINSKLRNKESVSDDVDAYNLIMKNKELLLDQNPEKSPVRFIFSHSALKEGWDNPNVFQICTLKQSNSDIRKRQEVGRGMRLCVNRDGERMDESTLGKDVHEINVLTVIASESYDSFARELQSEIEEAIGEKGNAQVNTMISNARNNNVELCVNPKRWEQPEFTELWRLISRKSEYTVEFSTEELVRKSIDALDRKLRIQSMAYRVESGNLKEIKSNDAKQIQTVFERTDLKIYDEKKRSESTIKYDLIGKLVLETGVTRHTVIQILAGIRPDTFAQFRKNPETFIIQTAKYINEEKESVMIQGIRYKAKDDRYDSNLFTETKIRGRLNMNAVKTQKHVYDHAIYRSEKELAFIQSMERDPAVLVYAKLPEGFVITTPIGRYTPDWIIGFQSTMGIKPVIVDFVSVNHSSQNFSAEEKKNTLHALCAEKHFAAFESNNISYVNCDNYQVLKNRVY